MKEYIKECYHEILRGYKLKATDYVILENLKIYICR